MTNALGSDASDEATLTVTDTLSGQVQVYANTLGTPFEPVLDTDAFDTCPRSGPAPSPAAPPQAQIEPSARVGNCTPSAERLCLASGRFAVEATWATTGAPVPAAAVSLTGDTGYFWFFDAGNVEVVLKVLDDCFGPSQRFWVFTTGLTDVGVMLQVTDTVTGQMREYGSPVGEPFAPIFDTNAFATCQ